MVYKYYPPSCFTCDALTNGYFFFCKASKQNDPYDMSFKLLKSDFILENLRYKEGEHKDVESIMGNYGSCCFSEVKDSKHMWAFYAENYHGLVVGFDENKFWNYYDKYLARIPYVKVSYLDTPIDDDIVVERKGTFELDMPLLKLYDPESEYLKSHEYAACISDSKLVDMLFTHLCCIKEKNTWAEEKEVRLIAALDIINEEVRLKKDGIVYLENGYKIPMPKDCIKEIYIGHNFNPSKFFAIEIIAKKHSVKNIFQTKIENPFQIEFIDITNRFNL